MKKALFALLLLSGILSAAVGCGVSAKQAETSENPDAALFRERYEAAFAVISPYYTAAGCAGEDSETMTGGSGIIWKKCGHYATMEELKTATRAVFTEKYAQSFFHIAFQAQPFEDGTPAYRETDDALWQDRTRLFDVSPWLAKTLEWEGKTIECLQWDTLKTVSANEDTVTYTIDFHWSYPGNPKTVWFELVKEDGTWKFDACFGDSMETAHLNAPAEVQQIAHKQMEDAIAIYSSTENDFAITDSELTCLTLLGADNLFRTPPLRFMRWNTASNRKLLIW